MPNTDEDSSSKSLEVNDTKKVGQEDGQVRAGEKCWSFFVTLLAFILILCTLHLLYYLFLHILPPPCTDTVQAVDILRTIPPSKTLTKDSAQVIDAVVYYKVRGVSQAMRLTIRRQP